LFLGTTASKDKETDAGVIKEESQQQTKRATSGLNPFKESQYSKN